MGGDEVAANTQEVEASQQAMTNTEDSDSLAQGPDENAVTLKMDPTRKQCGIVEKQINRFLDALNSVGIIGTLHAGGDFVWDPDKKDWVWQGDNPEPKAKVSPESKELQALNKEIADWQGAINSTNETQRTAQIEGKDVSMLVEAVRSMYKRIEELEKRKKESEAILNPSGQ
jgi:hypothetical protein